MYEKIILPTDGSESSEKEVLRATKLLKEGGEVIIVSVAMKIRAVQFQSKKHVRQTNEEAIKEAEKAVLNMKNLFDDDINVRTEVKVGFPAETINKLAADEGADLIIIANSGKSGVRKFVIGSVAEKVLSDAEVDVLLVHNAD